jgi:2,4-dienoyl-CoA reductase-like NADH-dependent reductase (Old Yellow Enzyme family)
MLFDAISIGGMAVSNRIMRSATCDWMAREGAVADAQVDLYRALAEGGVGLIVTGHMYVRADGDASQGMMGIDCDERIDGLKRLADVVHESGGAKIAAQINHGGRNAAMRFEAGDIVAPSAIPMKTGAPAPRALEAAEVHELAARFGEAAGRAKDAGYDAVQIHGAHGYLVSQFLSPLANARDDEFGGALENRARFLRLIVSEVNARVGAEYPVLVKLGAFDRGDGGFTIEEAVTVAGWLVEWGVSAIEVSGGVNANSTKRRIKPGQNEAPFLEYARAVKNAVSVPVATVNGYRSVAVMEKALAGGHADMISMCRPFIREPGLVKALESGAVEAVGCVSCNGCFGTRDTGIRCTRL